MPRVPYYTNADSWVFIHFFTLMGCCSSPEFPTRTFLSLTGRYLSLYLKPDLYKLCTLILNPNMTYPEFATEIRHD